MLRLAVLFLAVLSAVMSSTEALEIQLDLGSDLPASLQYRIPALVQKVATIVSSSPDVILSCGQHSQYGALVADDLKSLAAEGFSVRVAHSGSATIIAAAGNPPENQENPRYAQVAGRGSAYACYNAMQQLGFAFLHPLEPIAPSSLTMDSLATLRNISRQPTYAIRGFHIHTQHPLELTDLLTGFDVVVNGTVVETWDSMLNDYELFLEWCVANLQNRIEWLPLYAKDWAAYAFSSERQARFLNLTSLARSYGLYAGADAAIALQQQHAFPLVNSTTDFTHAQASINQRMAWLSQAGFDFLSTENGFSEFTHPQCDLMLQWINWTTEAAAAHHMEAFIKVHISAGQHCPNYTDPHTGEPINFNYLPTLGDERMGVMPHTVQYYNYEDPANTYGNANFSGMFDFLFQQLHTPRSVVYHPETAYWVNYDSSVPLFLPLYAYGRVSDLRHIQTYERANNVSMRGQMDFDSGWEWGYWVQGVVTARAAWSVCLPEDGCPTDSDAVAQSLSAITDWFGSQGAKLNQLLLDYIHAQRQLLIFGQPNASSPRPSDDTAYVKLNGQAYMQGWDAFSELPALVDPINSVQPIKEGFDAVWLNQAPDYWTKVRPILAAMNATFGDYSQQFAAMVTLVPTRFQALMQELADGAEITWLRARLLYALYDYAATKFNKHGQTNDWRVARLRDSEDALRAATAVIAHREQQYRVPIDRIAGWRKGPTSYIFNYVWPAHSLYFWWRDYAKATIATPETLSPCFRNIENPIDVMFGEGPANNITRVIQEYLQKHAGKLDFLTDCLDPPLNEPHYDF